MKKMFERLLKYIMLHKTSVVWGGAALLALLFSGFGGVCFFVLGAAMQTILNPMKVLDF